MTTVRPPRKSVLYQNVKKLLRTDKARASCAIHLKSAETYDYRTIHARIQKFFSGGGGGGGRRRSKFPEGVLRKISTWQKLIIWQLLPVGGGGGEVRTPCHPLWIRPCDRLAVSFRNVDKRQIQKSYDAHMKCKHIRHSPRSPTMSKRS